MTVHFAVSENIQATCEETFDLLHDYGRRLEWDTLLRRAYIENGSPPGKGAIAVCTARRLLGGFSFRTQYVVFDRPTVSAIKLISRAPFFAAWGASIRHRPTTNGHSTATYTMTFRCKPSWLAPVLEPIVKVIFRYETRRRLAALAAAFA